MGTNDTAITPAEERAREEVLRICRGRTWWATTCRATGRYQTALGYAFRVEVCRRRPRTKLRALLAWVYSKHQPELVAVGDSWTEVLGKLRAEEKVADCE